MRTAFKPRWFNALLIGAFATLMQFLSLVPAIAAFCEPDAEPQAAVLSYLIQPGLFAAYAGIALDEKNTSPASAALAFNTLAVLVLRFLSAPSEQQLYGQAIASSLLVLGHVAAGWQANRPCLK